MYALKSALQRRVVESAARPGVTAGAGYASAISWSYWTPLVSSPLDNQTDALKLAICDDIGDGAYDNE